MRVALRGRLSAPCVMHSLTRRRRPRASSPPPAPAAARARFTLVTITPDGTFSDWNTVVTNTGIPANGNPRNNVCDQDGSDNGEAAPHPDRDWLVQSTGRDLEQFAFTWDNNYLYFYTRRYASTNNIQRFIYYGDIDGDGQDGRRWHRRPTARSPSHIDWQGNNQSVSASTRYYYLESTAGGDDDGRWLGFRRRLRSAGGPAQRHRVAQRGSGARPTACRSEFRVDLVRARRSAGPTPIVFHVSALNSAINNSIPPNQIDDNAGGCGGGAGSLQYAGVTFTPDRTLTATHDTGQPSHPLLRAALRGARHHQRRQRRRHLRPDQRGVAERS